MQLIALV